jgi:hypothetical protein
MALAGERRAETTGIPRGSIMKKLMYIAAATLLVAGLSAAPVFAQGTTKPAASSSTKKMPMKARHMKSCYDYAWDSQAQKDCLAGKSAKPMAKKASTKKSTKKAAPTG